MPSSPAAAAQLLTGCPGSPQRRAGEQSRPCSILWDVLESVQPNKTRRAAFPGQEQYVTIDYPYENTPKWRRDNIKSINKRYQNADWFYGRLSRQDAEAVLMAGGGHRDFLLRESFTLIGDVILSIRTWDYVRHFQIKITPGCKFFFGEVHFSDLRDIVRHYKKHSLCYADGHRGPTRLMSLGNPVRRKLGP